MVQLAIFKKKEKTFYSVRAEFQILTVHLQGWYHVFFFSVEYKMHGSDEREFASLYDCFPPSETH